MPQRGGGRCKSLQAKPKSFLEPDAESSKRARCRVKSTRSLVVLEIKVVPRTSAL